MVETETPVPAGRFAAFRNPGFAAYWAALVLTGFAVQIQTVAVGWYVYDLTRNPFDLGLVGLSQFLPALVLVLVTGQVADRFPRRAVMGVCLLAMALASVGLLAVTALRLPVVWPIFLALGIFGAARAFYNPARQSILPNLVPRHHLANAIAVNATSNQVAFICGPVAGGFLYVLGAEVAYGVTTAFLVVSGVLVLVALPKMVRADGKSPPGWRTVAAGFTYIWTNKPVLGAVTLDLFAVLFGGAMALMPVYARDILDVGPAGLGMLKAAPAIGALAVAMLLVFRPLRIHAGLILFLSVAGFGLATLVFALSTVLWLSVAMLLLIGAFDMVSVNIRTVLIQLWTPDELRGRVNAVNQVFIGASNEVGAFRAGTMALWMGPVAAVAVGGGAILGIAALWYRAFPQLRAVRSLS